MSGLWPPPCETYAKARSPADIGEKRHATRHDAEDSAAPLRMSLPISAVDEIGTRLPTGAGAF